ncbi:hypothetical protein ACTA71_012638 [Dictyostelium dimigraforme]
MYDYSYNGDKFKSARVVSCLETTKLKLSLKEKLELKGLIVGVQEKLEIDNKNIAVGNNNKNNVETVTRIDNRVKDLMIHWKEQRMLNGFQVDCKSGFHLLNLVESIQYTAFRVGNKLYQFKRCTFGLKNSPAYLKRWIQSIIDEIDGFALAYVDDMVIFSHSRTVFFI